jgi:hypothetical protein
MNGRKLKEVTEEKKQHQTSPRKPPPPLITLRSPGSKWGGSLVPIPPLHHCLLLSDGCCKWTHETDSSVSLNSAAPRIPVASCRSLTLASSQEEHLEVSLCSNCAVRREACHGWPALSAYPTTCQGSDHWSRLTHLWKCFSLMFDGLLT